MLKLIDLTERLLNFGIVFALLAMLIAAPFVNTVAAQGPATINYTALGDSLAFGILDFSGGGYVPRYASYLGTDTRASVRLTNLGRNGWTSDQLLSALRTDGAFRSSVTTAQVVTFDIGGNDFIRARAVYKNRQCGGANNQDCFRTVAAAFKSNWDAILTELLSLRASSNTVLRTMDIYNPYVVEDRTADSWTDDGGLTDLQVLKPYIDDANNYIATTATANNIPFARVYQAFNGASGTEDPRAKGYITFDGLHPNDAGHKVIADLLRQLGYAPLDGSQPPPGSSLVLQFSSATSSVDEAAGRATITITRTGGDVPFPAVVSVDYTTSDQTPADARCDARASATASARCDYATTLDTLQFLPGETQKTVTIPITDDGFTEADERLTVTLSNAVGATLGSTSQLTLTIRDNDTTPAVANPVNTSAFFVRQHYIDFLSREPEADGLNAWINVLNRCNGGFPGSSPDCDRLTVSSSFFRSDEFQLKGFFVYRFYRTTFGRRPTYAEIIPDMRRVTGATDAEVTQKRARFAETWTTRADFKQLYDNLSNANFVDKLRENAGVTLSGDRDQLIADLDANRITRSEAVARVVESAEVTTRQFNEAFVAMQYFGYLRRDPEAEGYEAWLRYLIQNPSDYRTMVNGFVNSAEYRLRFGSQ